MTETAFPAVADAGALTASVASPAGSTEIDPPVASIEPSEAETVCEPAVFRFTENVCAPASPPVNACEAGSPACASLLVRPTVPV